MNTSKVISNSARSTVVCIDDYANACPQGRIHNSQLAEPITFSSLMGFFLSMEELLNQLELAQPFTAVRRFRSTAPAAPLTSNDLHVQGRLATFTVRVIFRQHASWQGTVQWMETEQEESFRSALELSMLMHSALSEPQSAGDAPEELPSQRIS